MLGRKCIVIIAVCDGRRLGARDGPQLNSGVREKDRRLNKKNVMMLFPRSHAVVGKTVVYRYRDVEEDK